MRFCTVSIIHFSFCSFIQGTKVILNVYDLSPANDMLYSIGMGLHHSGVEILGKEYCEFSQDISSIDL